jgi:hypothetical protein
MVWCGVVWRVVCGGWCVVWRRERERERERETGREGEREKQMEMVLREAKQRKVRCAPLASLNGL